MWITSLLVKNRNTYFVKIGKYCTHMYRDKRSYLHQLDVLINCLNLKNTILHLWKITSDFLWPRIRSSNLWLTCILCIKDTRVSHSAFLLLLFHTQFNHFTGTQLYISKCSIRDYQQNTLQPLNFSYLDGPHQLLFVFVSHVLCPTFPHPCKWKYIKDVHIQHIIKTTSSNSPSNIGVTQTQGKPVKFWQGCTFMGWIGRWLSDHLLILLIVTCW